MQKHSVKYHRNHMWEKFKIYIAKQTQNTVEYKVKGHCLS